MDSKPTVFVLEHNDELRLALCDEFTQGNFDVLHSANANDLFLALNESDIQLITIGWQLDGERGLDILKSVRQESDLGVIMIAEQTNLIDRVLGLELGADDFLTKPVAARELIARARSIIRRKQTNQPHQAECSGDIFNFDGWSLSLRTRTMTDSRGEPCKLTNTEFDLIVIFVSNPRRVLSRNNILQQLDPVNAMSDRAIDNHIAQIRKKLQHRSSRTLIKTIRGVGYIFSEPVYRCSASSSSTMHSALLARA